MASSESLFATKTARITAAAAGVAALFVMSLDVVERIIAVPSLPEGILRERITVTEFRREVREPEPPRERQAVTEPLIEHTADESDFEVDAKPEPPPPPPEPVPEPEPEPEPLPPPPEPIVEPPPPEPEPEPEPEPPPPEPEPVPEPEPEPPPPPPPPPEPEPPPPPPPEPKPEPKPVPKPKPAPKKPAAKPAPKPAPAKPAPAAEPAAPADAAPSGNAPAGTSGTSASAGSGGSAGTQGNAAKSDASQALALIIREIEAHKKYPRRARQTGIEGRVVLRVEIDAGGIVRSVTIGEKHNSVLLNRAALSAADGLAGMKLPVSQAMTVSVPVVFTLKD